MSREIKFRAWDEINKRMVEIKEIRFRYSLSKPYELRDDSGDIIGQGIVDKPDVMQYTGLTDKNGKEIYEGDIFEAPHDFGPGGYAKRIGFVELDPIAGYQWNYWDLNTIEVIGNIYENPELLNRKSEGNEK